MNIWSVVIYVIAALFAVQALLALMTAHRKNSLRQYLDEESQRTPTEQSSNDGGAGRTKAA